MENGLVIINEEGEDRDKAYVCLGSCRVARSRRLQCNDKNCTHFGKRLREVCVVYCCPTGHCPDSSKPANHEEGCQLCGLAKSAKAVVPRVQQFPILDPPEASRTYSSVLHNSTTGTGNAQSRLVSPTSWLAGRNTINQWITVDAGKIMDSIRGVAISNRRDAPHEMVKEVAIDVSTERGGEWTEVSLISSYTKLREEDYDNFAAVTFSRPTKARYVRIRALAWNTYISMRCALILDGEARRSAFLDECGKNGSFGLTCLVERKDEYRSIVDANELRPYSRFSEGSSYSEDGSSMTYDEDLGNASITSSRQKLIFIEKYLFGSAQVDNYELSTRLERCEREVQGSVDRINKLFRQCDLDG